jgi:hypothetical protein
MKEIKTVEPHTCPSCLAVKAPGASFLRVEGLLKGPPLGTDEARNRTLFRDGTDDVRQAPVPEQVVSAIIWGRFGRDRLMNGCHEVPSRDWRHLVVDA